MCSSPLKGHSRCCDVILTKPSFNCLPFEFAANLFWNELHTLKKHKKSFCWKKRGTENKEGKVGPKFSLNLPQHPYSGLLKEVFFLPSFLTSSIFLLSPSLSLEPSLNAVCIVFCWTHVLNRFVREAFGLPKGVLKRGGRYQHSLHLFTALWWHWLPEPQYAFYIFFFTPIYLVFLGLNPLVAAHQLIFLPDCRPHLDANEGLWPIWYPEIVLCFTDSHSLSCFIYTSCEKT